MPPVKKDPPKPLEVTADMVKSVQAKLLSLGYTMVGEADGALGDKTRDGILAFRQRNGLPLNVNVDQALLDKLKDAPPIIPPPQQFGASVNDVRQKVAAVDLVTKAQRNSWWAKFTAWVLSIPSLLVTLIGSMAQQSDQTLPLIATLRGTFTEVPWQAWLGLFGVVTFAFALLASKSNKHTAAVQSALVQGYQEGTVKNDLPPPTL